jgi:hypothetical protein
MGFRASATKSRREVEMIVARLRPQPAVPDGIRRVPVARAHGEPMLTAVPSDRPIGL